jgi:hypothetical protein
VRRHDHVAGRRPRRQRVAERPEGLLDERVRVEVAEADAVDDLVFLGLGLRLDADREQRDDPGTRI